MGIPEKPCLDLAATTSPTQLSGLRTNGSRMNPCSNFFTFLTSLAWNSTEQLWWMIPIPPFSWRNKLFYCKILVNKYQSCTWQTYSSMAENLYLLNTNMYRPVCLCLSQEFNLAGLPHSWHISGIRTEVWVALQTNFTFGWFQNVWKNQFQDRKWNWQIKFTVAFQFW